MAEVMVSPQRVELDSYLAAYEAAQVGDGAGRLHQHQAAVYIPGGDVRLAKAGEPVVPRARCERRAEQRAELLAAAHPVRVGGIARVDRPIRPADRRAAPAPLFVVSHRQDERRVRRLETQRGKVAGLGQRDARQQDGVAAHEVGRELRGRAAVGLHVHARGAAGGDVEAREEEQEEAHPHTGQAWSPGGTG